MFISYPYNDPMNSILILYSSHLPQFFYAMLAPLLLFAITVGISWRVALVLLCCVPLIPLSIDKILL